MDHTPSWFSLETWKHTTAFQVSLSSYANKYSLATVKSSIGS